MESPLQIINRRNEFDYDGFKRCIDDAANGVDNPPYTVTAVIGSQQTGKSSLLNQMFGTTFATRSGPIANRTTDGIWISIKTFNGKNTLIFDIEGMDSLEMKDQSMSFEYKAGLFALFVADIVMFNIFYEDISGSAASGFDVYEMIALVYADVNGRSYKKKTFLFLIRDWNAKTTKEEVEEAVKNKFINPIIYCNRGNGNSERRNLSSYFDYKIVIFPSYYDDFSNFKIEANKLKNYLIGFNSDHSLRALFADLLENFSLIWKKISEMDELDIPNLKERISEQECNSCVNRMLKDADEQLCHQWNTVDWHNIDITRFSEWEENFKGWIEKFKKSKLEKFDELMGPYDVNIVKTKREYLNEQFTRRFKYAFEHINIMREQFKVVEKIKKAERKFKIDSKKCEEDMKHANEQRQKLLREEEEAQLQHEEKITEISVRMRNESEESRRNMLMQQQIYFDTQKSLLDERKKKSEAETASLMLQLSKIQAEREEEERLFGKEKHRMATEIAALQSRIAHETSQLLNSTMKTERENGFVSFLKIAIPIAATAIFKLPFFLP